MPLSDTGPGAAHALGSPAHRFETLDAMRGVAALAVMAFHFLWNTRFHLFSQAFYGVDFFFCLSGVILVHSYERKIAGGMTFAQYMRRRAIRLYPFYFIGFALGSVLLIFYSTGSRDIGFHPIDYALSIFAGAIALPYPNPGAFPFVGDSTIPGPVFPTNIPAWSLFFEMIASAALYVMVRSRTKLQRIVIPSCLLWLALWIFYGSENMGWGTENFFGGFPRTAFMFFLGAAIYRWFRRQPHRISLSPWVLLILIAGALAAPPLFHNPGARMAQIAALTLFSPCAVWLGLMIEERSEPRRVFLYLGRMSYGIYAVHWPIYHLLALVLGCWPSTRWIADAPILFAGAAGAIVLALAHLLTSYVDEPVRRWLAKRGISRQQLAMA
jgi:peptidoglycan/LPS O-acetylase OafA/YrhL